MSTPDFKQFFKSATTHEPFGYQARLAGGNEGTACESELINIPTGCGKTAAVVLAWLWNRVAHPDETHRAKWPRRLIYCLPMRTLVEQTRDNVRDWLKNLCNLEWDGKSDHAGKVGVHILMGGEDKTDWDIHPEREAILIGTQDMLLSRALNRGYGMSRYRWPMHFGLLNNHCLWVMDETQLMGVAVETSAQLEGFRAAAARIQCPTWWMSATLDRRQLATVDHREPESGWPRVSLGDTDLAAPPVKARVGALKRLEAAEFALNGDTKKDYAKRVVELIKAKHTDSSLTLVIVNRVARAQAIYEALRKGGMPKERLALIHSRFRPIDREQHQKLLSGAGDRIMIATQAVEAGVDISARLLITELAPWSSLVQRFGRCNRAGEFISEAKVIWIDIDTASEDLALPYAAEELSTARAGLAQVGENVGSVSLEKVQIVVPPVVRPVLRRKDLLDLFDTTPDLCGNDLDISRYVRDGDDTDVQLFWRAIPEDGPAEGTPAPERRELCRVSIAEFDKFLKAKTKPRVFVWNALEDSWQEAKRPRPGAVYLIAAESGGYAEELGWTRDPKHQPKPVAPETLRPPEAMPNDPDSFISRWVRLEEHSADVVAAVRRVIAELALSREEFAALETAALWHDIGKAHEYFQRWMTLRSPDRSRELWAKSDHRQPPPKDRKGFRHELASALAWLIAAPVDAAERDLVAYLVAAHHGKVRLSIRALPNEPAPNDDRLHARGIWDGEELPATALPGGGTAPVRLDLSFMKMGDGPHGASWLARTVALRDRLGPFRLAYLETLLRVADMRASAAEENCAR